MSNPVPEGWSLVTIGEMISESRLPVEQDDPSKRLAVRLHLKGVGKRSERASDQVGATQYFERRAGQFVYGKQNLHKGAFGIVPVALDGFTSSQDIPAFDFKDGTHSFWFAHYFQQKDFYEGLEKIASGTGSKRIQPRDLYREVLLMPPLHEQEKIASILTSVDEVIESTQKQIDKLQDLKKATMNELLTKGIGHTEFKDSELGRIPRSWLIGDVSGFCDEVFLGLTAKVDYVEEGGVPLVRASDISEGKLSFESVRHISQAQHQKLTKFRRATAGDVLVSKSGSLGVCALVDTDREFSIYESIIALKPIASALDSHYLLWFLRSPLAQGQLEGDKVGSTVGHLNLNDFRGVKITVPPVDEQVLISRKLVAIADLAEKLSSKLQKICSLKKSLMQDLLTGKVRVSVN